MTAGLILLVVGLFFVTGTGLVGFYWAAKNGQFCNLSDGAASIFDSEEPEGTPTDRFPSTKRS